MAKKPTVPDIDPTNKSEALSLLMDLESIYRDQPVYIKVVRVLASVIDSDDSSLDDRKAAIEIAQKLDTRKRPPKRPKKLLPGDKDWRDSLSQKIEVLQQGLKRYLKRWPEEKALETLRKSRPFVRYLENHVDLVRLVEDDPEEIANDIIADIRGLKRDKMKFYMTDSRMKKAKGVD